MQKVFGSPIFHCDKLDKFLTGIFQHRIETVKRERMQKQFTNVEETERLNFRDGLFYLLCIPNSFRQNTQDFHC